MDPITAVGAVASIITLAQTALTLSTTLYGLGGALLSASDDLKSLADDLKTFSQSLTLLSRLLEDSKSWYSDDIYLLTAKVIKDCADLYVKIDGILSRLGGKGKASWMKRMKFVMKESQFRKLLSRLRDLKSTLATILMTLQVDLQLSLLNISSSSKLQRAPKVPLQPDTVQTLREAQEAVQKSRLLSVQATKLDGFVHIQVEEKSRDIWSNDRAYNPAALQTNSNSIFMFQQASNVGDPNRTSGQNSVLLRSLKSASLSDSFKSAINEKEPDIEIVREVEGVLHAFRTALEVLQQVMKRVHEEDKALYIEAGMLNYSLTRSLDIEQAHGSHYKRHGKAYLLALRGSQTTINQLQDIMATLMGEIITTLHIYSAVYEVLSPAGFQKLYSCSENCRIRTLFELDRLAALLFPQPLTLILLTSDPWNPPKPTPSRKSKYEIHVTEYDIEQRLSADYDHLWRSARRSALPSDSIGPQTLHPTDEGLYGRQPAHEAAKSGDVSSQSPGNAIKFKDARTSSMGVQSPKYSSNLSPLEQRATVDYDAGLIGKGRNLNAQSDVVIHEKKDYMIRAETRHVIDLPPSDYILSLADGDHQAAPSKFKRYNPKRVQKHTTTFQCNLCSKRLSREYDLHAHMRIHTTERQFVCTVCGKALTSQHDRKRHEDRHTNMRGSARERHLKQGPQEAVDRSQYQSDSSAKIDINNAKLRAGLSFAASSGATGAGSYFSTPEDIDEPRVKMSIEEALDEERKAVLALLGETALAPRGPWPYVNSAGSGAQYQQQFSPILPGISTQAAAMAATAAASGQGYRSYMPSDPSLQQASHRIGGGVPVKKERGPRSPQQMNNQIGHQLTQVQQNRGMSQQIPSPAVPISQPIMNHDAPKPSVALGGMPSTFPTSRSPVRSMFDISDESVVGLASVASTRMTNTDTENWRGDNKSQATTLIPTSKDSLPSTTSMTANQKTEKSSFIFDSESDAEAAAGLEALSLAEEQDTGRGSRSFRIHDPASSKAPAQALDDPNSTSDSDYDNIDMGLYGGGYDAHMSYGDDLTAYLGAAFSVLGGISGDAGLAATAGLGALAGRKLLDRPRSRLREGDDRNDRRHRRLAHLNDSISKHQPARLWQLAYMSVKELQPEIMQTLNSVFSSGLGIGIPYLPDFEVEWSKLAPEILKTLSADQRSAFEVSNTNNNAENIIKVIEAISGTLGLENSALAWWCVIVMLRTHEQFFWSPATDSTPKPNPQHLNSITEMFSQLSDIVSMIARYAVMENLYHQTLTMTLRADYEAALLTLCVTILQWFANAFTLAIAIRDDSADFLTLRQLPGAIWEEIKGLDQACQKFTVVVEMKHDGSESEEDGGETPESGADVEDVSDDNMDDLWGSDKEPGEKHEPVEP